MIEMTPYQALGIGVELYLNNQFSEAEKIFKSILKQAPHHPEVNYYLGLIYNNSEKLNLALDFFEIAIKNNPNESKYWINYIEQLIHCNRLNEAKAILIKVINNQLKGKETHHLSSILAGIDPSSSTKLQLWFSEQRGKLKYDSAKIVESFQNCEFQKTEKLSYEFIRSYPNHAYGWKALGASLQKLGRLVEAKNAAIRSIRINPNDSESLTNLANIYEELGDLKEAESFYRSALTAKSSSATTHYNLGSILYKLRQINEAEIYFLNAINLNKNFAEAYLFLGGINKDLGKLTKAEENFQLAIKIKPSYAEAFINLGNIQKDLGKISDADQSYRSALSLRPESSFAYSNLLFLNSYYGLLNSVDYLLLATKWEASFMSDESMQEARTKTFKRDSLEKRRLRLGYVSNDMRRHAVAFFIEQLFRNHNRDEVELFVYASNSIVDSTTSHLKSLVEHWVSIANCNDEKIVQQIEADQIDVLVDLSGHTQNNSLRIFAKRAAPVQVHYLGYMSSTGLTEMDYWIGDKVLIPIEFDNQYSEKVWRLPRTWVSYDGKPTIPLTAKSSNLDQRIRLGSFNNLGKISERTLKVWAQILLSLPHGKLLIKTKELADEKNRQRVLSIMLAYGITTERIELNDGKNTASWESHMSFYENLDIALDPIGGVGGGTTTCDALWMGVPVITVIGGTMGQRMTASMLDAIGRPEWIAKTETDYIKKVLELACNTSALADIRMNLRLQMSNSTLCDAAGLAISLESAYKKMFNEKFLSAKIIH